MTDLVPRTVTELGDDGSPTNRQPASEDYFDWGDILAGDDSTDWDRVLAGEDSGAASRVSRPLEDFRESAAYLLLGAPGAGKTELFKAEGKREDCQYVTAPEIHRTPISNSYHPSGATRPCSSTGLTRNGRVRRTDAHPWTPSGRGLKRSVVLGFACRAARRTGSGPTDRVHLETVSRDHKVKVLRLDPLSDEGIHDLLNRRPDVDEPDAFMEEARARGIDHLLTNPQNLNMLAKAVAGGVWPRTRLQTFELACDNLVRGA